MSFDYASCMRLTLLDSKYKYLYGLRTIVLNDKEGKRTYIKAIPLEALQVLDRPFFNSRLIQN